jgi:uncharacterized protein YgiM (DUF1202 family)
MKKFYLALWCFFAILAFSSCGGSASENSNGDDEGGETDVETLPDIDDANLALSTWEGHSVRTMSGAGGEWVATVTFGEKLELLGETEKDAKSQKDFTKVRLLDGKEGWVRADMIHTGGELAVIREESQIYSRPGISNIKDEVVAPGTLIIIIGNNEEFVEFTARNSGNNRQKGWMLGARGYSTDAIDISVGIMYRKALDEKLPEKRSAKLQAILDNSSYTASSLIPLVRAELEKANVPATPLGEDQLMITGDDVNVRSTPAVGENKLFKLSSGDVCDIVSEGSRETIGGKTDVWYQISFNGKTGWVFGSFTSLAQN